MTKLDEYCIYKEVGNCVDPKVHCCCCGIFTERNERYEIWSVYRLVLVLMVGWGLIKYKRRWTWSKNQLDKNLSAPIHRKKMTKSEAKKLDWQRGVYQNTDFGWRGKNGR